MDRIKNFIDDFLTDGSGDLNIFGKLIMIFIIFIIMNILTKFISRIIDRSLKNKRISHLYSSDKRANTLGQILKKIVKYLLYFVWAVMSLEMFGINTGSILATAGIGGIAIGFGAQSLVKDIITGFFILLEDQYSVGDYIKVGSFEGTVEELGLRVTKLRDFNGELHIIPNGNVTTVTNRNRGAMRALVVISISYEENIDRALKIIESVCSEIQKNNSNVVDGPTILGVTSLSAYSVDITIVAKTKAMEQWAVEREIRKKVKEAFDKENIHVPYPKRVIIGGKEE